MANIDRIIEAFYAEPWAITADKLESIALVIDARSQGVEFTRDDIRAAIGDGPASKKTSVVDGVAVVPVFGVISKRMNLMAEISGGTSADLLLRDLNAAIDNPAVSAIVLDVDSPGGGVIGPPEVAKAIFDGRAKKPIVAVSNGMMASAAYWIASAASEVVALPSGVMGSIGIYVAFRDTSKAAEKAGVETKIIRAGALKGMGEPGTTLTDEMVASMQERVDAYYGMFVEAVAKHRGMSLARAKELGDGRMFVGANAVAAGLADRTGTLEQVVSELAASSGRRTRVQGKGTSMSAVKENETGMTEADVEKAKAEARAAEKTRGVEITAICKGIWKDDLAKAVEKAGEFIASGLSIDEAKAKIADLIAEERKPLKNVIENGLSEADKVFAAASDGLSFRIMGEKATSFEVDEETGRLRYVKGKTRPLAPSARQFSRMRMIDIAKAALTSFGVRISGYDDLEIAAMALEWQGIPSASGGGSYMTSKDFPKILKDAINKTLLMAYAEAAATWRQWVKQAPSAVDFKDINRIRLGEGSDLEAVPDNEEFPEDKPGESLEKYAVTTFGKAWSLSRQQLINDDMNAFDTLPVRYGRAAERTVNRQIYAILTGNPNMSDDIALFHSSHSNVIASGAAPTVAQLNAMQLLFRNQTGLNTATPVKLNTEMRHLIIPAALEGGSKELLASMANPASSNGNPGVANIWQNRVNLVIESILDETSAAVYYGAADYSDVDTIEVAFLQGEETPRVEEQYDFKRKGRAYTIQQTFGVKAIDWRGLVRNAGA